MALSAAQEAVIDANVKGERERRSFKALLNAQQISAIADLNQDISASYTEAEVQAISDKVDAILAALRTHGILAT
jgi:acetolactate synthase small subunit